MATRQAPSGESSNVVALPLRAPRLPSGVGPSSEPKAPPVSPVRRPSAYELAARERKVGYLAITAVQVAHDAGKTLVELVEAMGRWSDEEWRKLAVVAGQNPPSATSREQVLERLRARAAQETIAPPAPAVRFVVCHRPQPGYAYKLESEPFDTRAEAEAVLKRRRELSTGSGFPVEAWIEERPVRS